MPAIDNVLQPVPVPSRFARKVFSSRLLIGLVIALVGVCFVRPDSMWNDQRVLGTTVSALLVFIGMALRFWGGGSAGSHTHSGEIEAPALATGGPFAYVRNPIYLGSIILGFGMVGLIGDPRLLALHALAFAMLYVVIIPAEEKFLRDQYGAAYEAYYAAVPRLVPRIRPWQGRCERPFNWQVCGGEARIATVLLLIYAAAEIAASLRG